MTTTHFHLCYLLLDLNAVLCVWWVINCCCLCRPNFFLLISSISSPEAQPVLFKTQLQNLERQAGETASLRCETTKPGASVVWRCGDSVLESSSKYQLKQEGTVVELVIYKLQAADSGEYSCDTGSQRTSAVLTVQGRHCYTDCER
uniref:Ig-like domain-containing protein n=1 Tax=Seriola lalandi dorsalis TaxID=1841481 RepID=A0A3B4Y230_SERLL